MPGVVRKAAHDGVDDPRIAQAVTEIMQFSFMPAVKALIANQTGDAGWRTMAAPLTALTDAQAQKLIADYGKLSGAKAA
jgi:4-hydroxy-tetrahydrodipicolinate synthase